MSGLKDSVIDGTRNKISVKSVFMMSIQESEEMSQLLKDGSIDLLLKWSEN